MAQNLSFEEEDKSKYVIWDGTTREEIVSNKYIKGTKVNAKTQMKK